ALGPADCTHGFHTITITDPEVLAALANPAVPFVLAVADAANVAAEADETNNDVSFVGIYQPADSAPAPLVIRGRDASDRLSDDANDTITISGSEELTISGTLTPQAFTVPAALVSEIDVAAAGGNDRVQGDETLTIPMHLFGGPGNDTLGGGAADD